MVGQSDGVAVVGAVGLKGPFVGQELALDQLALVQELAFVGLA